MVSTTKKWVTMAEAAKIEKKSLARIWQKRRDGFFNSARFCECGLRHMVKVSELNKPKPVDRRKDNRKALTNKAALPPIFEYEPLPAIEKRKYLSVKNASRLINRQPDYLVDKIRRGKLDFKVCECGLSRLIKASDAKKFK